jgi:hypothetical protein
MRGPPAIACVLTQPAVALVAFLITAILAKLYCSTTLSNRLQPLHNVCLEKPSDDNSACFEELIRVSTLMELPIILYIIEVLPV